MPAVLVVALVLAALSAVFAIQNSDVVAISFLGWQWQASLALVLILTLGVGVLIGYLAGLPASLKKGTELRRTQRALDRTAAQRSEDEASVDENSREL